MPTFNTHRTFWDDPYQTELDTTITSVDGDWVTLKETIFFAFSGGQESDQGSIHGLPVLQAEKTDHHIRYQLDSSHQLTVDQPVHVTIDWQRRYRLMRSHFAAEAVLEMVSQELEGIERIGSHVAANKSRIDFLSDENLSPNFPHWTEQANALFAQDLPIIKDFSDPETQRRYWEVAGFAKVSCGGTHINSTGEVGSIRLKRKNIGKGKERIEIYLNDPS